jgi:hypothetical protein
MPPPVQAHSSTIESVTYLIGTTPCYIMLIPSQQYAWTTVMHGNPKLVHDGGFDWGQISTAAMLHVFSTETISFSELELDLFRTSETATNLRVPFILTVGIDL